MPLKKYHINLTDVEKAYLAGFIDGEGCLTIKNGGPNCPNGRIQLNIYNTNEVILRYIRDKVGFGCVYVGTKEGKYNSKAKTCWRYEVAACQCFVLLSSLLPYLRVKREQAELLLQYGDSNKNEIRGKIHNLNKRGI